MHHLQPDEIGPLRKLLKRLKEDHCLIIYSDAVEKIKRGNIDRPYITITFDDGLKSSLRASQIIKEFGTRACFFICPSVIGQKDDQKIKEFCSQKIHRPPMEFLNWDDVEILMKEGHEVGSHSMNHENLGGLPIDRIQAEIVESFEILRKRIGGVRHFAWPYGRFSEFTPAAARIVFETGFQSCASAERGCHVLKREGDDFSLCIRRDPIMAKWPLSHILYFLSRSSKRASILDNQWPLGWLEAISGEAK
jgi:peptidoglycan/xylan/chitin deacetylase (PgdA/CDA1 family)